MEYPIEELAEPTGLQMSLQRLQEKAQECRQRLKAQDQAVNGIRQDAVDLRLQAEALKKSIAAMSGRLRAVAAGVSAVVPPPIAPVAHVVRPVPVQAPSPAAFAVPAVPVSVEPDPWPVVPASSRLLQALPYVFLVLAGLGYGLSSQALPSPQAAPAVAASPVVQPVADDPENEALSLVYEYRPTGLDQDMLDLVGAQEEVLGASPWEIECIAPDRYHVSFNSRPGAQEEPLYEFDVDLASKTVTPTPEPAEKLSPSLLARNS